MFLHFAYAKLFYILVPIFVLAVLYRLKLYRTPVYTYPLAAELKGSSFVRGSHHKKILFSLRFLTLFGLMLLVARPQWVDPNINLNVKGVDIVMALDVSGSMRLFDDLRDRRSRLEVAKAEAVRFIEKRTNDPIGIVLFGGDVISRCPLTLDKHILKEITSELHIGFLDSNATLLGSGLATSINRLKNSKSKSKVVIVLTDGIPSPDSVSPDVAIELAKKFGIKIYSIGIGRVKGGYDKDMFGRVVSIPDSVDMGLLNKISKNTGGKAFRAQNSKDMREIYDTIDALEKTDIKTNIFHNFHEAYENFLWIFLLIFSLELFLALFRFRGLSC